MSSELTPDQIAEYSEAAIAKTTDERERQTLLRLKQHSWNLAVCVQQLNEALGVSNAEPETDRRAG